MCESSESTTAHECEQIGEVLQRRVSDKELRRKQEQLVERFERIADREHQRQSSKCRAGGEKHDDGQVSDQAAVQSFAVHRVLHLKQSSSSRL